MTPADCLRLLAQASLLDPRVMPANPHDQDLKARMWSASIYDTVTYVQAQQVVITHYQTSNDAIGVADINGVTTSKTPMYLVPRAERPALPQLAAPPQPPPVKTEPCEECGNHFIHDTTVTTRGRACSKAPGPVKPPTHHDG